MSLSRDEVFALPFNNKSIKVVAAGHETPLSKVTVVAEDEYGRSVDFLLGRHDAILLAKALGITGEDLMASEIKG